MNIVSAGHRPYAYSSTQMHCKRMPQLLRTLHANHGAETRVCSSDVTLVFRSHTDLRECWFTLRLRKAFARLREDQTRALIGPEYLVRHSR